MEYPEFFDPYGEYCPDYTGYTFDLDEGVIVNPDGEVFESPVTSIAFQMAEEGKDPNPTLKQLLEKQHTDNPPEFLDPADALPDQPYSRHGNSIFFNDSSFARSVLTSEQSCKNKELTGWLIIPARQVTTIRSRASNHQKNNPILWIPDDEIDSEIRALFE